MASSTRPTLSSLAMILVIVCPPMMATGSAQETPSREAGKPASGNAQSPGASKKSGGKAALGKSNDETGKTGRSDTAKPASKAAGKDSRAADDPADRPSSAMPSGSPSKKDDLNQPASRAPADSVRPEASADRTGAGGEANNLLDLLRDRVILLFPDYDRLSDRADTSSHVVLPLAELQRFIRQEAQRQADRQSPARITGLRVRGELGEDLAKLELSFDVSFEATPDRPRGRLNLQLAEGQCLKALTGDGGTPALERNSGGPFSLSLDRAGTSVLHLTIAVPIERRGGERRLALTLPSAPVKSVELISAEPVAWCQRATGDNVPVDADRRTIRPLLGPADSIELAWQTRSEAALGDPPARQVETTVLLRVSEIDIVHDVTMLIQATGRAREWRFDVPSGARLASLRGDKADQPIAALDGEIRAAPPVVGPAEPAKPAPGNATKSAAATARPAPPVSGPSALVVRFSEPPTGPIRLRFRLETPRSGARQAIAAGLFPMPGVTEQSGRLIAVAGPGTSLRFQPDRVMQRLAVTDQDPELQRLQPRAAFRWPALPASLAVEIARTAPELTATHETSLRIQQEQTSWRCRFRVRISRTSIDELAVRVPIELAQIGVTGSRSIDLESVSTTSDEPALKELRLNLREPIEGELAFEITGTLPTTLDVARTLPAPTIPAARSQSGRIDLTPARNLWLRGIDESTSGVVRRSSAPAAAEGGRPDETPGWSFQAESALARVGYAVSRLPDRIEVTAAAEVRMFAGAMEVRDRIRLEFPLEPLARIRLRLPAEVQEVAIGGSAVISRAAPKEGEFELQLRPSPMVELDVSYRVRRSLERDVAPVSVPLATIADHPARERTVVVRGDPRLSVRAELPWTPLRSEAEGTWGWRHDGPADRVSFDVWRRGGGFATSIPRGILEFGVSASGRLQGGARLRLDPRSEPDLSLILPDDVTLLAASLNGAPIEVVDEGRGRARLSIPASTTSRLLEYRWEQVIRESGRSGPFAGRVFGRLPLTPPLPEAPVAIGTLIWTWSGPNSVEAIAAGAAQPLLRWSWGSLRPVPALRPETADDWLHDGLAESLRPPRDPGAAPRVWSALWSTAGDISGIRPFWVDRRWLTGPASVGLVGLVALIARLDPRRRTRALLIATVMMLVAMVLAPSSAAWFVMAIRPALVFLLALGLWRGWERWRSAERERSMTLPSGTRVNASRASNRRFAPLDLLMRLGERGASESGRGRLQGSSNRGADQANRSAEPVGESRADGPVRVGAP